IYQSFIEFVNRKVIYGLSVFVIMGGLGVSMPYVSDTLFAILPLFYRQILVVVVLGLAYVFILFILLKGIIRKTDGSQYILVIVTTFVTYFLLLILQVFYGTETGRIPVYLFLFMTVSLSL